MPSGWIQLMVLLVLCTPLVAEAQDDAPWWRQLFGQGQEVESGSMVPDGGDDGALPPQEEAIEEGEAGAADAGEVVAGDAMTRHPAVPVGSVSWVVPEAVALLDTLRQAPEEIRIPGYRVQLFMGRLDSARSLRLALLDNPEFEWEVHLTPYPPVFGLQVGDFRTPLAAHRAMGQLERRFPNALVVPAELELNRAFPSGGDCIWTPDVHPAHVD